MFFRRVKPKVLSLADRVANLKQYGMTPQPDSGGRVRVVRGNVAAILEDRGAEPPHLAAFGIVVGNEIAEPWSGGYQMFLMTPSGKKMPARAEHLEALHEFGEDLREGLGMPSYYNEGLGSTSAYHMYDRVEERDSAHEKNPWEVTTRLS